MKKIFLFTIILSLNIYAVNVSTFDIKGIKLGDNPNLIRSKIPNLEIVNASEYNMGHYIMWMRNNNINDSLVISLTHIEKVSEIRRIKKFRTKVNFNKIKKQLFRKYGKPRVKGYAAFNNNEGFAYAFCWGSCKKINISNKYWNGYSVENTWKEKSLIVKYSYFLNVNEISFLLRDEKAIYKDDKWLNKKSLKEEKEKIERESNIDL